MMTSMTGLDDRVITQVGDLPGAVAALKAAGARPLILMASQETAALMGAAWFKALLDAAAEAVPDASFSGILDCGAAAGRAMEALELGILDVVFTGPSDVAEKLAAIAGARGARLWTHPPTSDDLVPK